MADTEDILLLVQARFDSIQDARRWFEQEPLPGFGGKTAQRLVQTGRIAEVRDFIAAVDAGVHS